MNIVSFLLGVVATIVVEFVLAVVVAIKDIKNRRKHFEETMEMLNKIQVKVATEELKPKKTTTKKTTAKKTTKTKKGE